MPDAGRSEVECVAAPASGFISLRKNARLAHPKNEQKNNFCIWLINQCECSRNCQRKRKKESVLRLWKWNERRARALQTIPSREEHNKEKLLMKIAKNILSINTAENALILYFGASECVDSPITIHNITIPRWQIPANTTSFIPSTRQNHGDCLCDLAAVNWRKLAATFVVQCKWSERDRMLGTCHTS